jgi:hypothetical protein
LICNLAVQTAQYKRIGKGGRVGALKNKTA